MSETYGKLIVSDRYNSIINKLKNEGILSLEPEKVIEINDIFCDGSELELYTDHDKYYFSVRHKNGSLCAFNEDIIVPRNVTEKDAIEIAKFLHSGFIYEESALPIENEIYELEKSYKDLVDCLNKNDLNESLNKCDFYVDTLHKFSSYINIDANSMMINRKNAEKALLELGIDGIELKSCSEYKYNENKEMYCEFYLPYNYKYNPNIYTPI